MALTFDDLVHFLSEELAVDASDITGETLLFSSGLIDSFAFVSLLAHIETEGGFRIDSADVTLDHFDSVDRILIFADRAKAVTS